MAHQSLIKLTDLRNVTRAPDTQESHESMINPNTNRNNSNISNNGSTFDTNIYSTGSRVHWSSQQNAVERLKSKLMLSAFVQLVFLALALVFGILYYTCAVHSRTPTHKTHNITPVRHTMRLPTAVYPLKYELNISIDDSEKHFVGEMIIHVKAVEKCTNITLHMVDLNITNVSIMMATAPRLTVSPIQVIDVSPINGTDFHVFKLSSPLPAQSEARLKINYIGAYNPALTGVFRVSYMIGSESRWLVATQFEPTDARRAFPCFDEPAFKATFALRIGHPTSHSSVSNMPLSGNQTVAHKEHYVWDVYEETPKMPTYLLAFVLSDFDRVQLDRFTAYARSNAIESARYALNVTPTLLSFYEDYFGIPYPLEKLDLVAVPEFVAVAMENWGLMTFEEGRMLHDPAVSSALNEQRTATIVAHEISHQWFGNLVTMAWWDDLWLNEGFATFMELIGSDHINPRWRALEQFVPSDMQYVMRLDSLKSTRRISQAIVHEEDIEEAFDSISYSKGAALVRMMESFLTRDVFKKGLRSYLSEFAYKSATRHDLWRHLTQAARDSGQMANGTTVEEIMDGWTTKIGYPYLQVNRSYTTNVVNITQAQFTILSDDRITKDDISHEQGPWWVPITFKTSNSVSTTVTPLWLSGTSMNQAFGQLDSNDWILFNINATGYFRVNYDPRNWKLLTDCLKDRAQMKQIPPLSRSQLIDDALNMAEAGKLNYSIALNLTKYLLNEEDYLPWRSAHNTFLYLKTMMATEPEYDLFMSYIRRLIINIYDDDAADDILSPTTHSEPLVAQKRLEFMGLACKIGLLNCIEQSKELFRKWVVESPTNVTFIDANIRPIVYCSAVQNGGDENWMFLFGKFQADTVANERDVKLSALTCTRNPSIIKRMLSYALNEKHGIRRQDIDGMYMGFATNPIALPIAFDFIVDHIETLRTFYGSNGGYNINFLLLILAETMKTHHDHKRFVNFIEEQNITDSFVIRQSIENILINVQWMEKSYPAVVAWLKNDHKLENRSTELDL